MRIAQLAPLYESVPPKYYGGTERVVSYLTEALVRQGHEVVLFASGDSVTQAELVQVCRRSLWLDKACADTLAHHVLMMERVFQMASEFDIIHNHSDYLPFSLVRRTFTPTVSTLHGRLDSEDLKPLYEEFSDMPLVSISLAQQEPLPEANWVGNVYHGLPEELYTFQENPGEYLAFLGRISPDKGVHRAIEIAKKVGMPLKIAAKIADKEYYTQVVKPLIDGSFIEYVGEVCEEEKNQFLGNAYALLFPINWPEPFGLCMIEAMACGTPVVARCRGSVPEIVKDGVNGFVIETVGEAVEALLEVPKISRKRCREYFEEHFTDDQMVRNYEKVYQNLVLGAEAGHKVLALR
ncbi:MAG: N-acetyl-alpha-D-glucosaminyl L-malate synthase [Chlamydiae bacterium]|nr:N-acetyl-alpha-D-glucosaminyl L-malate synthase [Chlamydiota bacterium]